jgi:hypothetical protein
MDQEPLFDWPSLKEEELRQYASVYVGWATNEMSDPKDLHWSLAEFDCSKFENIDTDWDAYFKDDVLENPRYDKDFLQQEFHTPVVLSVEEGEIIIWDGWHRIACAMHRKDRTILAIIGNHQKQVTK